MKFFNLKSKIDESSSGIQFMRWGGLSPVIQDGYDLNRLKPNGTRENFHAPPARKGIYAFVQGHVEKFLLSKSAFDPKLHIKIDKSPNSEDFKDHEMTVFKTQKLHDEFDKLIDDPNFTDEDAAKYREMHQYVVKYGRPRTFTYRGELWHHLKNRVRGTDILDEKGWWIKTTFEVYEKALAREIAAERGTIARGGWKSSKDHLEVFIENP